MSRKLGRGRTKVPSLTLHEIQNLSSEEASEYLWGVEKALRRFKPVADFADILFMDNDELADRLMLAMMRSDLRERVKHGDVCT